MLERIKYGFVFATCITLGHGKQPKKKLAYQLALMEATSRLFVTRYSEQRENEQQKSASHSLLKTQKMLLTEKKHRVCKKITKIDGFLYIQKI